MIQPDRGPSKPARRAAVAVAIGLVIMLAIGLALPEPYSLAAETVVNQPLAEAEAAEAQRQAEIERLLRAVAADPDDRDALSQLADAYLAGSSAEDLQRAALVLLTIIGMEPDDPEPYGRLITAYIRAGAWTDAANATDALAELSPGIGGRAVLPRLDRMARRTGRRGCDLGVRPVPGRAPDDPRVPMIRALRAEAAAADIAGQAGARGTSIQNVEPTPSSLSRPQAPPWASAIWRTMASPSPALAPPRSRGPSSWSARARARSTL